MQLVRITIYHQVLKQPIFQSTRDINQTIYLEYLKAYPYAYIYIYIYFKKAFLLNDNT